MSARRSGVTSPFGDPRIDFSHGESGMASVDGIASGSQHSQAFGPRNEMLALPSLAGFGMGGSVSLCEALSRFRTDPPHVSRHPYLEIAEIVCCSDMRVTSFGVAAMRRVLTPRSPFVKFDASTDWMLT